MKTLEYLLKMEWSMGNGQCPECCGKEPGKGWWTDTIGHKKSCQLAESILSLGGAPTMEQKNPYRSIGTYISYNGAYVSVRASGPDSEKEKLRKYMDSK